LRSCTDAAILLLDLILAVGALFGGSRARKLPVSGRLGRALDT